MQVPHFSWIIFVSLVVLLLASLGVFMVLGSRWTSSRLVVELEQWARENDFKLRRLSADAAAPAPLADVQGIEPRWILTSGRTTLAQMQTATPPVGAPPAPMERWNVLVRETQWQWPTVALRPAEGSTSVLDLLPLVAVPTTIGKDRFIVLGRDSRGVRRLENLRIASLLPADVGLLLDGPYLMLEFSTRPFDRIELSRMLALAEQLAQLDVVAAGA
jgi:hypothetical protein